MASASAPGERHADRYIVMPGPPRGALSGAAAVTARPAPLVAAVAVAAGAGLTRRGVAGAVVGAVVAAWAAAVARIAADVVGPRAGAPADLVAAAPAGAAMTAHTAALVAADGVAAAARRPGADEALAVARGPGAARALAIAQVAADVVGPLAGLAAAGVADTGAGAVGAAGAAALVAAEVGGTGAGLGAARVACAPIGAPLAGRTGVPHTADWRLRRRTAEADAGIDVSRDDVGGADAVRRATVRRDGVPGRVRQQRAVHGAAVQIWGQIGRRTAVGDGAARVNCDPAAVELAPPQQDQGRDGDQRDQREA
jgi:hypothetical protein